MVLEHPRFKFQAVDESINGSSQASLVAFFPLDGTTPGRTSPYTLSRWANLYTLDFHKGAYLDDGSSWQRDLDGDGTEETYLYFRHSRNMYPSAFVLLSGAKVRVS